MEGEAKRRGLDCETSVPLIFDSYLKDDVVKMFEQTHVFTQVELQARNEVKWEIYTKKIQIEARVLGDLAINRYCSGGNSLPISLLDNVFKIKSLFPAEKRNYDSHSGYGGHRENSIPFADYKGKSTCDGRGS